MPEALTIKIPYELATYAVWQRSLVNKNHSNKFIKAIGTWCVLKAISRAPLQNFTQQRQILAALCQRSDSAFRSDINFLIKQKFIKKETGSLVLLSWQALADSLDLNFTTKKIFVYEKASKQPIAQWIIATDIEANQHKQAYMILKRLNKNPEKKRNFINAMIKEGDDAARLSTDNKYFISCLKSLYLSDFVQASEIHEDLIQVRPDTNRGVRGIATAWGHKNYKVHPTTISYWKKKMQQSGIIDVSKLSIESRDRVRNKSCHVIWLNTRRIRRQFPGRAKMQTMLQMCDQITVLQPRDAEMVKLCAA